MVPQKTILSRALFAAMAGASLLAADVAIAQQETTVTVTGSRLKRVDSEGALPVTVISREQIDTSGATSVAEVIRSVTFAAAGNFRPQSGSSAQSWASVDLKGLGSGRTLVLIDGRRAPKAPMVGSASDMNSIPLGAIERIEILTDGASAVYGSDAIGGVVNIITRKDFEGFQIMAGFTNPSNDGGERREASLLFGTSGKNGRVMGGMSFNGRGMVYTRQRPWGTDLGVSSFGNNYITSKGLQAVPGGCTDTNFWTASNGTCSFNFNAVAADEASVKNTALFSKGEYKINDNWKMYGNASITRVESFGRYAPTPGAVTLSATSPNNIAAQLDPSMAGKSVTLRHRFAAAGNRDTNTDNNVYDLLVGTQGSWGKTDIDAGFRWTDSQYRELGRNYIVGPLAEKYMNSGEYNIFKPSQNPASILNAIKATIGRDAFFRIAEVYTTASMPLMKLAGGDAQILFGAERRTEKYQDKYDSLSEAGVILGSAGNSAGGNRSVNSFFTESVLPVAKGVELSLAARHESYSDYGSDTSPKAALRWKIRPNLLVRGAVGTGFAAPSLPILTQKESFSAESVIDPATYVAFGGMPADANTKQVQVDTYFIANPDLSSEKSENASIGVVWDATDKISVKADYWQIKITDKIASIGAQTLVDRSNGSDPRAIPAGLGVKRSASNGAIERITAGYGNEGEIKTTGLDITADLSYRLSNIPLSHRLTLSRTISYIDDGDELAGTLGLPKHRAVLSTKATVMPKMDVYLNVNQIGENGTTRRMPSVRTYDLQVTTDGFIKGGKVSFGVVNLLGWYPGEKGATDKNLVAYDGRNFNYYLYDSYGRQTYIRYTHSF
jgi:iron complex outermembrane receptor protein